MKVININKIDEYPDNYDFLTAQEQSAIEQYMNDKQDSYNDYYEKHIANRDMKKDYLSLCNHMMDILSGSKTAFAVLNIKVEYNWKHDEKWHLTTKADYQEYNGLSDDCCCGTKKKDEKGYAAWPTPTKKEKVEDSPFVEPQEKLISFGDMKHYEY